MRKMALLATQYERTIADMLQQQTVCYGGCGSQSHDAVMITGKIG